MPNDWCDSNGLGTYAFLRADTACAARAVYQIWNRIVTFKQGQLRVNLLLNRVSPWADIDSYVPYQGRVVIKIKQPAELWVRVPEWVAPENVEANVNNSASELTIDRRYVGIGAVKAGDEVVVEFPISERTDVAVFRMGILEQTHSLVRKGNDVVAIFPRGRYYPYYRREHYRQNEPRWWNVTRFRTSHQGVASIGNP